ncbi:MAG: hypothetical protein ABI203_09125 [Mucilaginibacter sp.]
MAKKILLVAILAFICSFAMAQSGEKIALSVSLDVAVPSHNSTGPGFTLRTELPIAARLKFTFSAGFFTNFGRLLYYNTPANCVSCIIPMGPSNDAPYEFVPVKAGLRYYYLKYFYFEGNGGAAFNANKTVTSFIYGGSLGGLAPLSPHNSLDIGLGFESGYKLTDYNEIINELAIRVGYRYQF